MYDYVSARGDKTTDVISAPGPSPLLSAPPGTTPCTLITRRASLSLSRDMPTSGSANYSAAIVVLEPGGQRLNNWLSLLTVSQDLSLRLGIIEKDLLL